MSAHMMEEIEGQEGSTGTAQVHLGTTPKVGLQWSVQFPAGFSSEPIYLRISVASFLNPF